MTPNLTYFFYTFYIARVTPRKCRTTIGWRVFVWKFVLADVKFWPNGNPRYCTFLCPSLLVEMLLNRQLGLAAGELVFNSIPMSRSWKADSCRRTSPNRLLWFGRLGHQASAPPVRVKILVYVSCLIAQKQFCNNTNEILGAREWLMHCCKPEGCGLETRRGELIFLNSGRTRPLRASK
jgi:hypothetical protein